MALATWATVEHSVGVGVGAGCDMEQPLEACPSSFPNRLQHREHRREHGDCPHLIPLEGQACLIAFVFCGLGLLPKLGMESHALAMPASQLRTKTVVPVHFHWMTHDQAWSVGQDGFSMPDWPLQTLSEF